MNMANDLSNQKKDKTTGKFRPVKKKNPEGIELIKKTQSDLIAGYFDLDQIKDAYKACGHTNPANVKGMKAVIMGYNIEV